MKRRHVWIVRREDPIPWDLYGRVTVGEFMRIVERLKPGEFWTCDCQRGEDHE